MDRKDFIKAQKHLEQNFIRKRIYESSSNAQDSINHFTNKGLYVTFYMGMGETSDETIYIALYNFKYNYIICDDNFFKFEETLHYTMGIYRFNLNFYNIFAEMKILLEKRKERERENSARVIQSGCHNWLFSPKCRDGTIGIVPRLSLNKLNLI